MQPVSATDAVDLAFSHARSVLASRPFRPGRFFKVALVAALTQATFLSVALLYPLQALQFAFLYRLNSVPQQLVGSPAAAAVGLGLLLVFVVLAVLITVGLLYLVCRLRVTLFALVVGRQLRVRDAWRRYPTATRRYLLLFLLAMLVWWAVVAAALGPFLIAFVRTAMEQAHSGASAGVPSPRMTAQLFTLVAAGWLLLPVQLVVDALLEDFLLPVLSLEPESSVRRAFGRLGALARHHLGQLLLFLLLRTVVALGIGIALGVVAGILVGSTGLAEFFLGKLLYSQLWPGSLGAHALFFAIAVAMLFAIGLLHILCMLVVYGATGTFKTSYAAIFFAGYYPPLAFALGFGEDDALVGAGLSPRLPGPPPLQARADLPDLW